MIKSNYEFEVIVHGSSAKEYYHNGSTYIEGKEGTSFSLRMRNNSGKRVLFVPTIDGLSIMNGKEASFKSRGYIVGAYSSETIHGWRTSDDKVSEFFFSTPSQSYAKRKGKGGNLGVIGCAVFKEKYREPEVRVIEKHIYHEIHGSGCNCPKCRPVNYPQWNGNYPFQTGTLTGPVTNTAYTMSSASANSFQVLNLSAQASAGLGTGFGQDKYSPVVTVDFNKESSPDTTFSIFYNTRERLADMGVEFVRPIYAEKTPSAFPSEDGYCERP